MRITRMSQSSSVSTLSIMPPSSRPAAAAPRPGSRALGPGLHLEHVLLHVDGSTRSWTVRPRRRAEQSGDRERPYGAHQPFCPSEEKGDVGSEGRRHYADLGHKKSTATSALGS